MKICFVYKTIYPGVLTEINRIPIYLAEKGINVTLIVLGWEKFNGIKDKLSNNVEIYRINLGQNKKSTSKFILESIKLINKQNFDLVHVFHFRGVCLLPILCKKRNIKWLLDIRSGNLKNDLRRPLANFITKFESKFFDKVAVIHRGLAKEIFGNNNKLNKYYEFPIGVDLSLFKKKPETPKKKNITFGLDSYVICYIGHLYPERNLHNLIKAIYISKKSIPNLKLLFIGDGKDKNRLKEITERLGLAKDIIFTGFIKYEEIPEYLNISDVAISYVPITQGYDIQPPLKTIEYLANGLPVIATDTKGNRLFIKDGENGLLVKDDPESLSEAIIKIVKNPELREKIIKNARKSVESYDWKNIIEEKILPVYKELIMNKELIKR